MYIGLHFYVKTSWLQNCPVMQKSNSNDLQFKNGSKQLFPNATKNVQNRWEYRYTVKAARQTGRTGQILLYRLYHYRYEILLYRWKH